MHIEPIFPIGMLVHDVPQDVADEVEKFVVSKLSLMPDRGGPAPHSTDYFEPKKIIPDLTKDLPRLWLELRQCKDAYQEGNNFKAINRQLKTNTSEFEYWCQDYLEGDIHAEHEHGIGRISGIYWVRANEAAGGIMFKNPNPFTEYSQDYDINAMWSWQGTIYKPIKGRMLMFPSYLKHSVLPSEEGVERTTVAFNF
jgi:hypothetical protein